MGNREVTVNMKTMREWIERNQPMALEKLAVASLISARTISELFNGKAPRLPRTRFQIARAMGVPIEKLFSPVKG